MACALALFAAGALLVGIDKLDSGLLDFAQVYPFIFIGTSVGLAGGAVVCASEARAAARRS